MLRTDEDPELLVFDPVIRFFHWLTLFLVATIFVLAFSIDFAVVQGGGRCTHPAASFVLA
jgi:cytochrome b561